VYELTKKQKPFVCLKIMILMEYAEGETLREFIDTTHATLSRKVIFDLFIQLMNALKHIHANGLVHRDIKPENIFINRKTGQLQVGDFGLAKNLIKLDPESCSPGFELR
jgi:translation initiation factor 2-alpha kinase 4